jgi:predicted Ser/Thr protein kinase
MRPEPFAAGTVLEQRYRIDSEVGRGGMGVVYQGTDLTLQRPVAIKALTVSHADADTINQFMQEARALASIEHPQVVPVYAVGRHGGCYFMVMQFIAGRPLSEILKERGALPVDEVRQLLAQTLEALAALHERDLLHRDLKPGNLMIGANGRVTVMDLGISKKLGDADQTSAGLGTPRYMPPEMINEVEEDARADLYSLGVIAWHCLVGRPPFDGPTPMAILYKQAHEPAEPVRNAAPQVPKDLAELVDQALQKAPEDRLASAEAMAEALRGGPKPATAGGRFGALLLAVFLVAGGLSAGWWLNHADQREAVDAGAVSAAAPDALVVDAGPVEDAQIKDAAPPVDAAPKPVAPKPVPKVSIKITSKPSGAYVFHRGRRLGRTPMVLERPTSRRGLQLSFERNGFGKAQITVSQSKDGQAHVKLEPLFDLVP